MKKCVHTSPPTRPRSASGRVARTRKEAAVQLVRVEFDVSRIASTLEQAKARVQQQERELDQLRQRQQKLVDFLKV